MLPLLSVGSSSSDNLTLDPWEITYLTSAYQRRQRAAIGNALQYALL